MRNLIRVNLRRWMNNLLTIFFSLGILCVSAFNCLMVYHEEYIGVEVFDPEYIPMLMIAAMLFTAAAILIHHFDTEPLRNAVIAGYSKTQIFFASVIPAIIYAVAAALVMLLPMLRKPKLLLRLPVPYLLLCALGIILMFAAGAVFITAISMNISNKPIGIVAAVICLIGGLIAADPICSALMEPESFPHYRPKTDAVHKSSLMIREDYPNPEYIGEPDRTHYKTICMLLPQTAIPLMDTYLNRGVSETVSGSVPVCNDVDFVCTESEQMLRILPFAQLGMILIYAGCGVYLFRKKDFK